MKFTDDLAPWRGNRGGTDGVWHTEDLLLRSPREPHELCVPQGVERFAEAERQPRRQRELELRYGSLPPGLFLLKRPALLGVCVRNSFSTRQAFGRRCLNVLGALRRDCL